MKKVKLPWYTCSRVAEAFSDIVELEALPPGLLETLRRINETAEETTSGSKSQSERSKAGYTYEARESTSTAATTPKS